MIFALSLLLVAGTAVQANRPAGAIKAQTVLAPSDERQSATAHPKPAIITVSAQILPSVQIRFKTSGADKRKTDRQFSSPGQSGGSIMIEFY